MPRKLSTIAPDWWDYTTLDDEIIRDAAKLTQQQTVEKVCQHGIAHTAPLPQPKLAGWGGGGSLSLHKS